MPTRKVLPLGSYLRGLSFFSLVAADFLPWLEDRGLCGCDLLAPSGGAGFEGRPGGGLPPSVSIKKQVASWACFNHALQRGVLLLLLSL